MCIVHLAAVSVQQQRPSTTKNTQFPFFSCRARFKRVAPRKTCSSIVSFGAGMHVCGFAWRFLLDFSFFGSWSNTERKRGKSSHSRPSLSFWTARVDGFSKPLTATQPCEGAFSYLLSFYRFLLFLISTDSLSLTLSEYLLRLLLFSLFFFSSLHICCACLVCGVLLTNGLTGCVKS